MYHICLVTQDLPIRLAAYGKQWSRLEKGAKLISRKATTREYLMKKDLEVEGKQRAMVLCQMHKRHDEWHYEGEDPLCMLSVSDLEFLQKVAPAQVKAKKPRRKAVTAGM